MPWILGFRNIERVFRFIIGFISSIFDSLAVPNLIPTRLHFFNFQRTADIILLGYLLFLEYYIVLLHVAVVITLNLSYVEVEFVPVIFLIRIALFAFRVAPSHMFIKTFWPSQFLAPKGFRFLFMNAWVSESFPSHHDIIIVYHLINILILIPLTSRFQWWSYFWLDSLKLAHALFFSQGVLLRIWSLYIDFPLVDFLLVFRGFLAKSRHILAFFV